MRGDIKKRLQEINKGMVPDDYRYQQRLGIVPSEWKVGQFSNVVKNVQRPVPKPDVPYWRLGIRSHAKGTFHEFVKDPDTVAMDELYRVEENDLVVNITFAWEHAVALADAKDVGKLVSHRFPTYVFKDKQTPKYFEGVVMQPRFKEMLANISPGGAGRNRVLSKKDFLKLPCCIPPQKEQGKIAEILNQCDKVIELKQRLIEEERNRKKWLMKNLLDPDSGVRLPGFDGKWKKGKIGLYLKITHGRSQHQVEHLDGKYPILASGGEIGRTNTAVYDKPSVLIGRKGTIDKPMYIDDPFWTVDTLFYSRIKKNAVPKFVYYLFSRINWRKYDESTGVPSLSAKTIENIDVLVPPTIDEQCVISKVLTSVDDKIYLLGQELTQWQQKKKALMQLLLTGIVRVSV